MNIYIYYKCGTFVPSQSKRINVRCLRDVGRPSYLLREQRVIAAMVRECVYELGKANITAMTAVCAQSSLSVSSQS